MALGVVSSTLALIVGGIAFLILMEQPKEIGAMIGAGLASIFVWRVLDAILDLD